MNIFTKIAEARIREAIERGDFDNLENSGRPLKLEEDEWIPEDLRMAYRILRNSDCIPPELELRKEIFSLRDLIGTIDDDQKRIGKIRELNFKLLKFNETRKRPLVLENFPVYEPKICEKFIK